MRVGRGDENVIPANAALLRRHCFRFVEEVARHHATIDDDDHERLFSVGEGEGPCMDRALYDLDGATRHPAVHKDGELLRRHVGDGAPGSEFGPGDEGGEGEKEKDEQSTHGPILEWPEEMRQSLRRRIRVRRIVTLASRQ